MKKFVIKTLFFFMLAILFANMHRIFNGYQIEMIHPFFLQPKIEISRQWYYLFLGELLSYSCIWLWIISTLAPIFNYFEYRDEKPTNPYLIFITLWYNIFWVCFYASLLDTVHYILAFKRIGIWFIIQTSVFLLLSMYFICAAYYLNKKKN